MDARVAGQLSGVGHSIPSRGNEQALESRAQPAVKRAPNADSSPDQSATVFDANGDGAIEHWSYAHGGDSYKTFKPPPSGKAGANLRRVSHAPPVGPTARADRHASSRPATAAALHHAHEAYQRDGGAPTADVHAAAAATVARAPEATRAPDAHAAASVTQAAPAPALPSLRP